MESLLPQELPVAVDLLDSVVLLRRGRLRLLRLLGSLLAFSKTAGKAGQLVV